jgi:uncharacterized protein (TIGR02301 family)
MRSVAVFVAMLFAGAAFAQERPSEEREVLAALVRVMGESQAMRQACLGPYDRYWRSRLDQLIDTEGAEPEFEQRLKAGFEAGFDAGRRAFPACSDLSRHAEAEAAGRGRALAARLASVQRRVPGWQPTLPDDATMAGTSEPR